MIPAAIQRLLWCILVLTVSSAMSEPAGSVGTNQPGAAPRPGFRVLVLAESGGHHGETNQYYRDFVAAMRGIGYDGYFSYELCHQLPVVDGQTVGIAFADQNARLTAEYMRGRSKS